MADDWKPGDLALCVRLIPKPDGNGLIIRPGMIFRVEAVVHGVLWKGGFTATGLRLEGVVAHPKHGNPSRCACSTRFRKIHPLNEAERAAAMRELNAPAREKSDA